MRNYPFTRILSLLVACFPAVAFAQNMGWVDSVANGLLAVMSRLVVLLTAAALAVFVWGLVMFIRNSGDEKAHEEGRRKMVWGIVALFVIVSVWGLVNLLQNITGTGNPAQVTAPQVGP